MIEAGERACLTSTNRQRKESTGLFQKCLAVCLRSLLLRVKCPDTADVQTSKGRRGRTLDPYFNFGTAGKFKDLKMLKLFLIQKGKLYLFIAYLLSKVKGVIT